MKKASTLTVLAAASLLAMPVLAQDKAPAAAAPTVSAIADALGVREKVTATAVVLAVDQRHRLLTLKGEDGKPVTIKVGPEVRNLAQVQAGDTVVATYHQALAVALETVQGTGINARLVTVSAGRAPEGALPGGVVEEKVQMLGTILAVDQAKRTVLIQGAVHHVTLQIPPDMDIKDLKTGDQVRATYTQELAVVVEPTAGPGPWFENKQN
jgi:FtsP/CotA-like multicopper oxidase with cupredoxin domain